MNFLAHAVLAGDAPAMVIGGIVGDWIKGPLPACLPADLARGVALHRAIDSHAERHPAFRRSRSRVSAMRRRYAGVLVDIFYDHLLARDWAMFHPQPFIEFRAAVYSLVASRRGDLPEHLRLGLELMASEDWFGSYARIDGIAEVLARMSRRVRRPNPLAGGEVELLADVEAYAADFQAWLDDARKFAADWQQNEASRIPGMAS